MSVPSGVCGHETERPDRLPPEIGACTCVRPTWNGTNRCVWHADRRAKPRAAVTQQAAPPQRVDDAVLDGVTLDGVSFRGWTMPRAGFEDADLTGADFRDATLPESSFDGATVADGTFQNADLRRASVRRVDGDGAEFSRASAANLDASNANLDGADFHDVTAPGAVFDDATARRAAFDYATTPSAQFRGAGLEDAEFVRASLPGADFTNAMLREASLVQVRANGSVFDDAVLKSVDLTDADFEDATMWGATLERANCTRTRLLSADLRAATLYGATLAEVHANSATEFPEPPPTEPDRAAWTYRAVERVARENSLSRLGRKSFVARKDARRAEARTDGDSGTWLYLWGTNALMRYGVSWLRVVGVSAVAVAVFAVAFTLVGGVRPSTSSSAPVAFNTVSVSVPEPVAALAVNAYFSAVTFTTLGYGDLQPATGAAQTLAGVESYLGAVLIALLVYVFGRRSEW